jgi:hypothetical protein
MREGVRQTLNDIGFLLCLQGCLKKTQGVFVILGSVRKSFYMKDLMMDIEN